MAWVALACLRGVGEQPALQPDVLLRAQLRGLQLALVRGGLAALHGVPQRSLQRGSVNLPLDQEVLGSCGQRRPPAGVVHAPCQHHDRQLGQLGPQPLEGAQADGVRESEVEKHADGIPGPRVECGLQGREVGDLNVWGHVEQHLGHDQRVTSVTSVVLDEHERRTTHPTLCMA